MKTENAQFVVILMAKDKYKIREYRNEKQNYYENVQWKRIALNY